MLSRTPSHNRRRKGRGLLRKGYFCEIGFAEALFALRDVEAALHFSASLRASKREATLYSSSVDERVTRYFLEEESSLVTGATSSFVGVATSLSAPGADPPKRNFRPSGKVMLTPTPLCSKALD